MSVLAMSLLIVDDVPASTPPRALTLPRKPHARDLFYFCHGLLVQGYSAVILFLFVAYLGQTATANCIKAYHTNKSGFYFFFLDLVVNF